MVLSPISKSKVVINMRGFVPPDNVDGVSKIQYAVVYAPRAKRHRFSANCVKIFSTKQEAISNADSTKDLLAARVLGPSKSSEGHHLNRCTSSAMN